MTDYRELHQRTGQNQWVVTQDAVTASALEYCQVQANPDVTFIV